MQASEAKKHKRPILVRELASRVVPIDADGTISFMFEMAPSATCDGQPSIRERVFRELFLAQDLGEHQQPAGLAFHLLAAHIRSCTSVRRCV